MDGGEAAEAGQAPEAYAIQLVQATPLAGPGVELSGSALPCARVLRSVAACVTAEPATKATRKARRVRPKLSRAAARPEMEALVTDAQSAKNPATTVLPKGRELIVPVQNPVTCATGCGSFGNFAGYYASRFDVTLAQIDATVAQRPDDTED